MGSYSRRQFLGTLGIAAGAGCATSRPWLVPAEPIIDIHQHTGYHGNSDETLVRHQRAMGVTTTVLLPAGAYYGLDAQCGGNESVQRLSRRYPKSFVYFANELPYLKQAKTVIEKYLRSGAIGIGEQKFRVLADSAYLERMAGIAKDFKVPILLHFWDGDYNMELQRFHKILEKFPTVNFIGHAQTWWGHIDAKHDPAVMYPKGQVTPGGLTDRLLSDYPNMFGDLSAGSGLNALTRDPEHARGFFDRHRTKLLFGSDCADTFGYGPTCTGTQILRAVREFAPTKEAERMIVYENARQLLRI
jgi:predicted TIM-barrel fold metal-dependent hydrolase